MMTKKQKNKNQSMQLKRHRKKRRNLSDRNVDMTKKLLKLEENLNRVSFFGRSNEGCFKLKPDREIFILTADRNDAQHAII